MFRNAQLAGTFLGGDLVLQRSQQVFGVDSRLEIYRSILENWDSNYLFGVGIGEFDALFATYKPESLEKLIMRAHNDYLEFAYTAGILNLLLLLLIATIILRSVYKKITEGDGRNLGYYACGVATCGLVGAHAAIDFPLQIPAISYGFVIILAATYSLTSSSKRSN